MERGRKQIRELNLEQTPTSSEIAASHCYKLSGKKKNPISLPLLESQAVGEEAIPDRTTPPRNTLKTASAQVGDLPKRFLMLPLPGIPLQQKVGTFFVLFDLFWPVCSHLCTDWWQTGELPRCLHVCLMCHSAALQESTLLFSAEFL